MNDIQEAVAIGKERSYSIELVNDLDELTRMTVWLHDVAVSQHLHEDIIFSLDLCLNELVANIISYAFPDKNKHEICIKLCLVWDRDYLKVILEDEGIQFDPLDAPEPEKFKSLDKAQIGGLGIALVRKFMDEMHYQRINNCINSLTLIKKLNG